MENWVICLHTKRNCSILQAYQAFWKKKLKIQNGRHFWRLKYSLKLGKASLHRYPVGKTFCRIHSIWHSFRDTSIFVFCNFCENSKGPSFLVGQKILKIGSATCHHFWQEKYSLKLGKVDLHRNPVGQKFCRNRFIPHGFRDTSIFVFCDFCKKFENSKWPPFLAGQKFFENWISYSEDVPCWSKISSKSLYLARFSRFLCFAILKKIRKLKMASFLASEIFVEIWKGWSSQIHCGSKILPKSH